MLLISFSSILQYLKVSNYYSTQINFATGFPTTYKTDLSIWPYPNQKPHELTSFPQINPK